MPAMLDLPIHEHNVFPLVWTFHLFQQNFALFKVEVFYHCCIQFSPKYFAFLCQYNGMAWLILSLGY
jgi:hypothetical protein